MFEPTIMLFLFPFYQKNIAELKLLTKLVDI